MTSGSAALSDLETRIQEEHVAGPYRLGWRLLYGPASTLTSARVVFLGLNPGGREVDEDHAVFSSENGSAYRIESWKGRLPGEEKLQVQVLALFRRLNLDADAVLSGNLIPFRSPSWREMPERQRALRFGCGLWKEILGNINPRLVITMGAETFTALKPKGNAGKEMSVSAGWGSVRIKCAESNGTLYVGLPHLSRFSIMTRPESEPGLRDAFAKFSTESTHS